MNFDQWFEYNGYSVESKEAFRFVWNAAMESANERIKALEDEIESLEQELDDEALNHRADMQRML